MFTTFFTLWLIMFADGSTTHQDTRYPQQGENVVSVCVDNNADGECDGDVGINGGGVGYGD